MPKRSQSCSKEAKYFPRRHRTKSRLKLSKESRVKMENEQIVIELKRTFCIWNGAIFISKESK